MKLPSLLSLVAALAPLALTAFTPASFAQASGQSRPIPGRYIVVFKSTVANPAADAADLVRGAGGQLHHTYGSAIKGFAATLPDAALQGLRNNPNVNYVEQDQTVSLNQVSSPQNQATWGLDRIDQADRPLDTQYNFTGTGAGVNAFIIDTGIRSDHVEFTGRIKPGFTVINDGNGTNDCHSHGTHVAGIVGGTTWGVAKGVALIPVRVLGCTGSGPWSDVIAGIDWVANSTLRPAVANLSIGGSASSALDSAVAGAVAKGVTMVVAAGNNNLDACSYSPSRAPSAITVGATTSNDVRAIYSNFGACVDLFAPGSGIVSASNADTTSSKILSGTSMASPHVAGVAALTLQSNPAALPAAIADYLQSTATPNRLTSTSLGTGSPNLLLYSLGNGSAAPAPVAKTVAFMSMAGNAVKTGGNWRASAVVTVRDVNSGATVSSATVAGSFSPGGAATCVTSDNGSCTLSSGPIKLNAAQSTALSGTGISGTLLNYDASQNAVTQIVISKP
jgi:subtilisin family serine protease